MLLSQFNHKDKSQFDTYIRPIDIYIFGFFSKDKKALYIKRDYFMFNNYDITHLDLQ